VAGAQLLARRLRWNRAVSEPPRQQPITVLLGPVGSGKTTELAAIARDCGGGIVHATFDFDGRPSASTVEVLADLAKQFANDWRNRPDVHFTRFTLGLIAVQAPLTGTTAEQDKDTLRRLIDDVFRNRRAERVINLINPLADAAARANVLTRPMAETVKLLLPPLIKTISRQSLRDAKRWHSDIPQAEGAYWLDALRALNRAARDLAADDRHAAMTAWLTSAFLADIRENQPRLAKPEPGSPCECEHPNRAKIRHFHNWMLLLDNVDQPAGEEFVEQLIQARERHLRDQPGGHDALAVIATSGRWDSAWEEDLWCPPWTMPPDPPGDRRPVPSCRAATYRDWDRDRVPEILRPWIFPVLLEPLSIDETAKFLGIAESDPRCMLAQHATGGLPAALAQLRPLLRDAEPAAGARNVLWRGHTVRSSVWEPRLTALRISLDNTDIAEFLLAAPWATAPWLIPSDEQEQIGPVHVPNILTELRTALWVTVPARGGGTANYAELNPWLAGSLMSALMARPKPRNRPAEYLAQFEELLSDQATRFDPVRTVYCQLALGRFGEVAGFFESTFNAIPHREWVDQLRLVTGAPDNMSTTESSGALYEKLVDADVKEQPTDRSPVRNVVTRLVAALWLARNPFAMPDPAQWVVIRDAYTDLRKLSHRGDVAPLTTAAERAARGQF